ncbi:putative MFS transporter, AGZA family, xanthine/uracil permease [Acetitomaculum ruminis DSM 5522]|uniref:Putative MFS transporter, AGZA family, xanthine/uracil permease n=1 Tax=Acetitomaculum ruminis DSM 5522 TaxID=1120918 RepID=A0A1I0Z3Z3_9FIRM|nr:NCS2 family permease [Acetitomaculum ruminis]SFB20335.1 putative MFS transporter, AGZA family, xanthine/uracil permease [Acetitomaculum ruminis DSM 5522]
MLERLFKLKENNTDVKTEIVAGITTFITMAYILAVNPSMLVDAGMDKDAVMLATALAAAFGCLCMGLLSNYPFALAAGMGLNATFTYTLCIGLGVSWKLGLFAVFVEGLVFILLSLVNVREAIFNAIPKNLKFAISTGLGFFITLIGLENAGIVVADESTLVGMANISGDFANQGIAILLTMIGALAIIILMIRGIKGAMLIGIFGVWIIGIILQITGIFQYPISLLPSFKDVNYGALSITFGQCFNLDFTGVDIGKYISLVISLLFIDIFDTLGGIIGLASNTNMLDENGKLPKIKGALLADALATTAGAIFGTSTTTTFVESATGMEAGGRTGLTAITTGFLFLLSCLLAPVFTAIPSFATAPALIVVGVFLMKSVTNIDFGDLSEGFPAFICIAATAFTYSISNGMAFGIISYTVITLLSGKAKEKKLSTLMIILSIIFIINYAAL